MQELALASDNQLRSIAQMKASYDYAASPKRKMEHNFALSVPIMDSLLIGATTKGSLKKKVLAGGTQLKDWGIFLAVTHVYNKVVDKIVEKSETLQKFRDNSPIAFGVANTILGVATGLSGIKYINKGYKKFIAPLIPNKFKTFTKNVLNSTDSSAIGTAINNGVKNFAKNYPKLTKGLNKAAIWAMPVLCGAFLASIAIDLFKAKSNENKTFKQLQDARLAAAQTIVAQK